MRWGIASIPACMLYGRLRGPLMEDEDRLLIQRLRATKNEVCCQVADAFAKAYESPDELMMMFQELRPLLGDEKSFQSLDHFLQKARHIARALLNDYEQT